MVRGQIPTRIYNIRPSTTDKVRFFRPDEMYTAYFLFDYISHRHGLICPCNSSTLVPRRQFPPDLR